MATNNFFEELKKYFETTPREKVLEDWTKSEKLDEVGPTVEEFLTHTSKFHKVHLKDPVTSSMNFKNTNVSPEFSSGFLFNKHFRNAESSVFNR